MPTVSTLAFKNPNFNWNDDISRNLLCNNEIPFNTYFVTSQNDMHVAFGQEIANWLSEEIKGNFQSPHLSLKNVTLSATKTNLCVNETFHVQTNVTL